MHTNNLTCKARLLSTCDWPKVSLTCLALLALSALPTASIGQSPLPPEKPTWDGNGVDPQSGGWSLSVPILSIGPANTGLKYDMHLGSGIWGNSFSGFYEKWTYGSSEWRETMSLGMDAATSVNGFIAASDGTRFSGQKYVKRDGTVIDFEFQVDGGIGPPALSN